MYIQQINSNVMTQALERNNLAPWHFYNNFHIFVEYPKCMITIFSSIVANLSTIVIPGT